MAKKTTKWQAPDREPQNLRQWTPEGHIHEDVECLRIYAHLLHGELLQAGFFASSEHIKSYHIAEEVLAKFPAQAHGKASVVNQRLVFIAEHEGLISVEDDPSREDYGVTIVMPFFEVTEWRGHHIPKDHIPKNVKN